MVAKPTQTAASIIRHFNLQPHPEGGHFRETFRDTNLVAGRSASTAIYFLLQAGEISRWHTVDAAEGWHYYAGSALRLDIVAADRKMTSITLGIDFAAGEQPQAIVPAHAWQRAQSLGEWTLVGCTVAPGFDFAGFKLAPAGFEPGL